MGQKPLECTRDKCLEYLGSAAEQQKTHTIFTFCHGVSKKTCTKLRNFKRALVYIYLTPRLKAVLGTKPKMSGLCEALISQMIQCAFFDRNLKSITECYFQHTKFIFVRGLVVFGFFYLLKSVSEKAEFE